MIDAISTPSVRALPEPTATTDSSVISSDFETFLVMLTAQMENQDPLNPVESTDFATQLATFSGVEQQVRTNDLLEAMLSDAGTAGIGSLSGWVGKEARILGAAAFDGRPVDVAIDPAPAAERAVLVVKDATGREIERKEVALTQKTALWGGPPQVGAGVAPYDFTLESYAGGALLATDQMPYYAQVTEARMTGGATEIVTDTGAVIPSALVFGLRLPGAG